MKFPSPLHRPALVFIGTQLLSLGEVAEEISIKSSAGAPNSISSVDHEDSKTKAKLQRGLRSELLGTSCLRISKGFSKQTNAQK